MIAAGPQWLCVVIVKLCVSRDQHNDDGDSGGDRSVAAAAAVAGDAVRSSRQR